MAAIHGAPELVVTMLGACVAVFGVWYTPWDTPDDLRKYRDMFGAARFVALSCFALAISILMILAYEGWLVYTAASTGILLLITYRAAVELLYQRTGNESIMSKFV